MSGVQLESQGHHDLNRHEPRAGLSQTRASLINADHEWSCDYEQGRERERQIIDLGHTPDYQSRHELVGFENPHMDDFENPNTSERARDAIERYEDEWEASQ
eukprot:SAG11_NODE_11661_length_745_cov_2.741486_1_plen_102_part_00